MQDLSSLKEDQLVLPTVGGLLTTGTPARSLGDILYSDSFAY